MNGFTLVAAGLALLYLWGWRRLVRRGTRWPAARLAAFLAGAATLGVALSPPVLAWAHHDFRGHMLVHLAAAMLAPLGLVMAAPVTLALKTLPPAWGRGWVWLVSRRPLRVIAHPVSAALLNVGGMAVLYLTELYALMATSETFRLWLHWHFVLAGTLFTWAIVGPDPAPRRPPPAIRFVVLLVAMAGHAVIAKWMVGWQLPQGVAPAALHQGAELMFYVGALPEACMAYWLARQWLVPRLPEPTPTVGGVRRSPARAARAPGQTRGRHPSPARAGPGRD